MTGPTCGRQDIRADRQRRLIMQTLFEVLFIVSMILPPAIVVAGGALVLGEALRRHGTLARNRVSAGHAMTFDQPVRH
jgi:hypothetical protein